MWEELETGIKIYAKNTPYFGEGNKDADILVVFDHPFEKQLVGSENFKVLSNIFNFVK